MVTDDYDSPWKEIVECYFEEFMRFFFPNAAREIDWPRGYQFLDKELQQIAREAVTGRRYVDKLAQVWRNDGTETWLLIHIEVQGERESDFEQRMFIYHCRLFDRFQRQVVSLAVLADDHPRWRPRRFGYKLWGCAVTFSFPTVKLLDFKKRWAELETDPSLFAVVVMAHLKTRETRRDDKRRYGWKLRLIRMLYERNLPKEEIIRLFRFIDWLMRLPRELEDDWWSAVKQLEEEKRMPYITTGERIGMEKGLQQGLQQGRQEGRQEGLLKAVELGLKLKFGAAGLALLPEIAALTDLAALEKIVAALEQAATPEELRRAYQQ